MAVKKLIEYIQEAKEKKTAVGHFNISNIEALWGIFNAARKLNVPVIIGTAEGERDFIGTRQAAVLVKSLREQFDYPIFINADHTYSFEKIVEAVEAGYDSVIVDGTKLSFDENVTLTKKCVEYVKSVNPEILVEGEIGYIGTSSKLLDSIPEDISLNNDSLTKPEDAKRFVDETGVDLLAPAIGNVHGMLKSGIDPSLKPEVVKSISEVVDIPLVLHGASGNTDEDILKVIEAGISLIHVNTELRVAYKNALKKSLQDNPDEVAPYRLLKESVKAISTVTENKLRLFSKLDA